MIDTRAQREERARLIAEAQALIPSNGAMSKEADEKFERIMADANALKSTIEKAERASAIDAELRASQPLPSSVPASAVEQVKEKEEKRAKAFSKFLRVGERNLNAEELSEIRSLSDTTGTAGAYTIPSGFQNELETALKFYGSVRKVARLIKTTTGNPLPFPTMNDTQNVGAILSGSAAEADMSFNVVNFGSYTYTTKTITVPNELLQDSAFDLEAEIKKAFVDRIGRIQNTHFTVGTNSSQPQGIVPFAVTAADGVTGTTGEATSVTFDNLQDLVHSLDIAYRPGAKFMFHDATLQALSKLKDGYGRYLLEAGVNTGAADKIWGYDYVVNNDMPVMAANANSILFGEFSKYVIRDIDGYSIKRLNELQALSNATVFVGFARADARGLDAGTHPIAVYTNSAT